MALDPMLLGWLALASFFLGLARMGLALKGYQNKRLGNALLAVSALAAASVITLAVWPLAGRVFGASHSWAPWMAVATLVLLSAPWFWKRIDRSRRAEPEPLTESKITTAPPPSAERAPPMPVAAAPTPIKRLPDRVPASESYSTRGKQVYDPEGRRVGGPHPSRSSAMRAAHQFAHRDDLQKKRRKWVAAGYRLLVDRTCQKFNWLDPESKAYDDKRRAEWLLLREMNSDALWHFADYNIFPSIRHELGAEERARDLLRKDPDAFCAWVEKKLLAI